MGETLTQQRRVKEEGLRIVNFCLLGRKLTVPKEEATANYVPAAAVIRRWQALSGIPLSSPALKMPSISGSPEVEPRYFTTDLNTRLRALYTQ